MSGLEERFYDRMDHDSKERAEAFEDDYGEENICKKQEKTKNL